MSDEKIKKRYKVIMIGNSGVGKTSIIERLCRNKYNPYNISPTVGAAFSIHKVYITYDGSDYEIELDIWDTAGQERYRALVPVYIRNSSAILYVFDLSDHSSYDSIVNYWTEKVGECGTPDINFLIANKHDICNKSPDIAKFADMIDNNYEYYQTSASNGYNIKKIFKNLAKRLIDKKGLEIENYGIGEEKNKIGDLCCK